VPDEVKALSSFLLSAHALSNLAQTRGLRRRSSDFLRLCAFVGACGSDAKRREADSPPAFRFTRGTPQLLQSLLYKNLQNM